MLDTPKSFKVGDVVVLKSGGPEMTVSDQNKGFVTTVWFSDKGIVEQFCFSQELLKESR